MRADIKALLEYCYAADTVVGVDTEFVPHPDGLSEACGVVPVTVQLAGVNAVGDIVSFLLFADELPTLGPWLKSNARKVAHNANCDRHVIENTGLVTANFTDTMTLARYLFPTLSSFGLKDLHVHFCGGDPADNMSWSKRFGQTSAADLATPGHPRHEEFLAYAVKDPVMTVELWEQLEAELGKRGQ